jgi:hypothetical protein
MTQERFPKQNQEPTSRTSAHKLNFMAPSSSFTIFNVNPLSSEENESLQKARLNSKGASQPLKLSKQSVVYNEFKYQTANSAVKYNTAS